jgi:biopolymer transport protein ExbD
MKKKRRRRLAAILVPVASMADIAFLLIIFFMVCSHFAKDPGEKIDPPTTLQVNPLDDFPMVVLIDKNGNIYFQGKKVSGHEQIEDEVRRYVEGKTDEKSRTVMVRCDREVLKHKFEPVYEAIAKGGGRIAAVGEKSKN